MSQPKYCTTFWTAGVLSAALIGLSNNLMAQENPPFVDDQAVQQQGVETLTRGPLHEAFAEVIAYNPQPGLTVPRQPPEPIDELPPSEKPANAEAIWIPGYWTWEEDRNDFIWVSGVWRVPPPGAQWVPGYWIKVEDGYQWVSGYWWYGEEQQDVTEVTYLPQPPESLEAGPSSPQPSEDQFWVPGCWIWKDVRYVWRPGYWARVQPDWVWIAAHYIWTPSGCVFVDGHWDYVLHRRGLCFAPAYLEPAIYTQPTFRYQPAVVIDVHVVHYHLFCRPRYYHYYFGDYYDQQYVQRGIVPWFELYHSRIGYDPFFVYNRWYYKQHHPDVDWGQRVRNWYEYRVRHPDARPPRTYADMRRLLRGPEGRGSELLEVAISLNVAATRKEFPVRLERVDESYRERMIDLRKQVRSFGEERGRLESQLRDRERDGGKFDRPRDLKFPSASPVSPERLRLAEQPRRGERPDRGERPETPAPPSKPETPLPPQVPGKPDRPGAPGRPDVPGKPQTPDFRERPGRPEGPERPDVPGRPDRPGRPERPGLPETPQESERRTPPQGPQPPQVPGKPERPFGPGAQDRPGGPGRPDTPRDSGRPDFQQPEGPGERQPRGPEGQRPGFDQRGRDGQRRSFRLPDASTPGGPSPFGPPSQQGPGDRGGRFDPPGQQEPSGRPNFGAPGQPGPGGNRFQTPGRPDGFQQRNFRGPDRPESPDGGRFGRPDQRGGIPGGFGPDRSGMPEPPTGRRGPGGSPGLDGGIRGGQQENPRFGPNRGGSQSPGGSPDVDGGRRGGSQFRPFSPRGPSFGGGDRPGGDRSNRSEARSGSPGGDDDGGPPPRSKGRGRDND